ncbi:MAG: TonB-dependent siderophore receptor [Pseudomonadota bacterium]
MKNVGISTIALAAALVSGAAHAQTAPAEKDKLELEDIVVTADKSGYGANLVQVGTFRNARIIDVPLTVNVVPQELLRAQAAQGLFDALRNTAGVSRSNASGVSADNFTIRGIRVENRTSFRLNGSLPIINLVDLPIENKDRVEVLKGVGALYYGYSPPSGIINMVTKRADRDVTDFTASINDSGGTRTAIDIGRKITDNFGLRVNAGAGIVAPGIKNVTGDRYFASLAADFAVSDALKFRFDIEHVQKDIPEVATLTAPAVASVLVPPVVAGKRTIPDIPAIDLNLGGSGLRNYARATNVLLRADLKLGSQFALTLEGGQAQTTRDRDSPTLTNYDLRPTSANYGNGTLSISRTRDQQYRNRNIRAELAAVFMTGPVKHNLIVGGNMNWRYQNGRSATTVTIAQNIFNPTNIQLQEPTTFTTSPLDVRDSGAYVTDRLEIGPVDLLAGVRYSDYQSRTASTTGAVTEFQVQTWTPSYGIVVKPMSNLSLYATYLEGLEEVTPAPLNAANAQAVLPPAKSEQYEAGIKYEPRTGFLIQLAGFQIERASAFTDPVDNIYKLAGRARYKGIEASAAGEITRDLSLYLSGTYLDAKVINATPATLIGNRPEETPEWTGSASIEYRLPMIRGLAIGGSAFYVSSRPVNAQNEAFIDGSTVYGASIRYKVPGVAKDMTIQLNVDNLTNLRYWAGTGSNLLGYGVPRQAKLTVRVGL